jgi:hypothetical protein
LGLLGTGGREDGKPFKSYPERRRTNNIKNSSEPGRILGIFGSDGP